SQDQLRRLTAARAAVSRRSWSAVGDELVGHYRAVLAGAPAAGLSALG
ncbi:glycosyl transferase family 1, partial [Micromonospora globispora]